MPKILRSLVAFLLAMASVTAVGTHPAHAIAHGQDVRDGAYRFAVLLTMTGLPAAGDGTRDSSCSGALVARDWVITAGHCFRDEAGKHVSRPVARQTIATIGRAQVKGPGGHEIEVTAVRQSPTSDVALAKLATAVTDIAPLRTSSVAATPGETLRLTGYGSIAGTSGYLPAARLQTGEFTVGRVRDAVLETSGLTPHSDTSPCSHDSGGPYFRERPGAQPELVALVSDGPDCPHTGPDVSARTDNITEWITSTVEPSGSDWLGDPAVLAGVVLVAASAFLVWTASRRLRRRGGLTTTPAEHHLRE